MVSTTLLFKTSQYLQDVVGTEAIGEIPDKHWPAAHKLPLFLQNLYNFYVMTLFGHRCLLMLSISQEGAAPAVVRKHWQEVHRYYQGEILYIVETVSSYNRKRLIQQRVPFLIPSNQLYIPMLGIDLREYFKSARQIESSFLGSATQATLIREILHGDCSGLAAKELAHLMGYSPMTITRTINELTHWKLAKITKVGREKHLAFPFSGKELWQAALPQLKTPVTKRVLVSLSDESINEIQTNDFLAGDSALAQKTSLGDTGTSQWAITAKKWSSLARRDSICVLKTSSLDTITHHSADESVIALEVWAYNPNITALESSCVDPISLHLSLGKSQDDRVRIACEDLLKQMWGTLDVEG